MLQEQNLSQIYGIIEAVSFHNGETGFTVLEFISEGELVTVVGVLPEVFPGEELKIQGQWGSHPTFGRQFKIENFQRYMPASVEAILRYLSSGAIKGIGPSTAAKIVEKFGEETLEIMEKEPHKLSLIKGISKNKAEKIANEYSAQFGLRETMLFLGKYGISPSEALRVWKKWGMQANDKIQENPYALCTEGVNISFERADSVAFDLQKSDDDIYRVRAGIVYVLRHNLTNGHTCLPLEKLISVAGQFLKVSEDAVRAEINSAADEDQIAIHDIEEKSFIFLPELFNAETYCAGRLKMMLSFPPDEIKGVDRKIEEIENAHGIKYAQMQKEAIIEATSKGMLVLTGGPGTGKTTTINAIIEILESRGDKVDIAAPTGRAAKRLTEITGREAKTIHRLLEAEYMPDERSVFARDERNPLDCDALVIDELSMTDSLLFDSLLRAVPMRCRLIMVGDSDQLPSVGAGNVLHDMIISEEIPVVHLKKIFRQAEKSAIVTNAHKIVKGQMPDLTLKNSDFFFITASKADLARDKIIELCSERLPRAYGYDPLKDIQILAPGKKGSVGTIELNKHLQEILNPASKSKKEHNIRFTTLREGDKVIQIKNNYDLFWTRNDGTSGNGVYNGDIGILLKIDRITSTITVRFDERDTIYTFEDAQELDLAYALTVHKSQGSEFEAVVMPVFPGPPQLYYRNLLYTAVTRAKKIMVLVGLQSTVQKMVENNKETKRYTGLKEFLIYGENN